MCMDCAAWSFCSTFFLPFSRTPSLSFYRSDSFALAIRFVQQNSHTWTNKWQRQQQQIWLNITFSFANAACGRYCCFCPFHSHSHMHKTIRIISALNFVYLPLHTHAVDTVHYYTIHTHTHTRAHSFLAIPLRRSRMCAREFFFRLVSSSLIRSLCLFVRSVVFVNVSVNKNISKVDTSQRNTNIASEKKKYKKSQACKWNVLCLCVYVQGN